MEILESKLIAFAIEKQLILKDSKIFPGLDDRTEIKFTVISPLAYASKNTFLLLLCLEFFPV